MATKVTLVVLLLSAITLTHFANAHCTNRSSNSAESTQAGVASGTGSEQQLQGQSDSQPTDGHHHGGFFHEVGCTLRRGAKRVGEGITNTVNYIRDKFRPSSKDSNNPANVTVTSWTNSEVVLPEFDIDVRGNFESERQIAITTLAPTNDSETEQPEGLGMRFLFEGVKMCPEGQKLDHNKNCRAV